MKATYSPRINIVYFELFEIFVESNERCQTNDQSQSLNGNADVDLSATSCYRQNANAAQRLGVESIFRRAPKNMYEDERENMEEYGPYCRSKMKKDD
ncbi:hypothetical protein YC2023_023249 [Brassica napus]